MKRHWLFLTVLAVVLIGGLAFIGEANAQQGRDQGIQRAIQAQERHTPNLMARRGVVGTGVGLDPQGRPVIRVFVEDEDAARMPAQLDGVPVEREVTGLFRALSTTARHRPAPIGVSTGHGDITAGTIGARVRDVNGTLYALSNNHVYANSNRASVGDPVYQPGPFDAQPTEDNILGHLSDYVEIKFARGRSGPANTVDAAIAESTEAKLGNATLEDGYGVPNSETKAAVVGTEVQKYGRTTGLTEGKVSEINVSVWVDFGQGRRAYFVSQIRITPGGFSAGGDSGSLVVTKDGNHPVGLLFAGSDTSTVANPIDEVLNAFGVVIDDGEPVEPPATGSIAGAVTDVDTQSPIAGATVAANGKEAITASDGTYTLDEVPVGDVEVTASAEGYESQTESVNVLEGETATIDFALAAEEPDDPDDPDDPDGDVKMYVDVDYSPRAGGRHLTVTLTVMTVDGNEPVAGAAVVAELQRDGEPYRNITGETDSSGVISRNFNNIPDGTYTVSVDSVDKDGFVWDEEQPTGDHTKP